MFLSIVEKLFPKVKPKPIPVIVAAELDNAAPTPALTAINHVIPAARPSRRKPKPAVTAIDQVVPAALPPRCKPTLSLKDRTKSSRKKTYTQLYPSIPYVAGVLFISYEDEKTGEKSVRYMSLFADDVCLEASWEVRQHYESQLPFAEILKAHRETPLSDALPVEIEQKIADFMNWSWFGKTKHKFHSFAIEFTSNKRKKPQIIHHRDLEPYVSMFPETAPTVFPDWIKFVRSPDEAGKSLYRSLTKLESPMKSS